MESGRAGFGCDDRYLQRHVQQTCADSQAALHGSLYTACIIMACIGMASIATSSIVMPSILMAYVYLHDFINSGRAVLRRLEPLTGDYAARNRVVGDLPVRFQPVRPVCVARA